jgi:hypothetical protein
MDPAGTGVAPSTGATVSTWNDKSISAKHGTSSGTPTYVEGGGINFNGNCFFYNLAFAQNLSQRSIFIVYKETTHNNGLGIFNLIPNPSSGTDSETVTGLSIETTYGWRVWGNGGADQSDFFLTSPVVKGIFNNNMNERASSGFLNGTSTTSRTASYTAGTCSGYGVGARWQGSTSMASKLDGVIYEILFFNTALGLSDRQSVEGYLAQKWSLTGSLPANHPGLTNTYYVAGANSSIVLRRPALTKIPYFSVFTPLSFSGCTLWLDASQDTTSNGVSIASLVDRSGSGNSLTPSGTISAATNFLRGKTVYNFGSSRASKTNFSWQTSFTQIVLVKCATGNWLSSLVSGGSYLAYIFAGNDNLINVNNFFNPTDSSKAVGTSVFTYAADGVTSWIILSLGYQSNATSASNYTINGTVKTSATSTAVSSAISATNQLWLNGNASSTFDTGVYVAEMMHYNSVLTNSQRQQVESYLGQKWGLLRYLPTDHGFYTNPGGGPQLGLVKSTISMTQRYAIVSAGLVYHLDAGNASSYPGSGSTWTDLTGSGISMTLYGSPTYSSANGVYLSFVPSSSQYGETSTSLPATSTWTIETFIYYNATNNSGYPCIFTDNFPGNSGTIQWALGALSDEGGAQQLQVGYYSSGWFTTPQQTPLSSGNWYHITGTYDGTNIKLYINGSINQTTASSTAPVHNSGGHRIMRRWDDVEYWGGNLAVLRLYNSALSLTDVSQNYSAQKARFGLS